MSLLQTRTERRYTRDLQVPLAEDDLEMENGWRCVPIPPALDEEWEVFDESKDYKTGWQREACVVAIGATLAGAGRQGAECHRLTDEVRAILAALGRR
jgi:hypothetical protein